MRVTKRVGIISLLLALAVLLTGCSDSWYGSGIVRDKYIRGPYTSYYYIKAIPHPMHHPTCHHLTVVEDNGEEHNGCVDVPTWTKATVGERITLTEDTKEYK